MSIERRRRRPEAKKEAAQQPPVNTTASEKSVPASENAGKQPRELDTIQEGAPLAPETTKHKRRSHGNFTEAEWEQVVKGFQHLKSRVDKAHSLALGTSPTEAQSSNKGNPNAESNNKSELGSNVPSDRLDHQKDET